MVLDSILPGHRIPTASVEESCVNFNEETNNMVANKQVRLTRWVLAACLLLGACQPGGQRPPTQAYDENLAAALLSKGQAALAKDQLTTPENDNAFYYFRKVLLMAPDQPDARSGLEAIFDRYLQFARVAIKNGDFTKAVAMVNQAEQILLPTKISTALRAEILDAQQKAADSTRARKNTKNKAVATEGIEYLLSIEGLNKKDKKIRERLKLIAEHTQTLKGSVRIEARDEAEGQWIHEQLKADVPKFTLHADIRKSLYPKVVVLRPD